MIVGVAQSVVLRRVTIDDMLRSWDLVPMGLVGLANVLMFPSIRHLVVCFAAPMA